MAETRRPTNEGTLPAAVPDALALHVESLRVLRQVKAMLAELLARTASR